MNAVSIAGSQSYVRNVLAVLSVAFFWILPSSPLIAVAALVMTTQESGWSRKLAIAGAVLSAAFTTAAAGAVISQAIQAGLI